MNSEQPEKLRNDDATDVKIDPIESEPSHQTEGREEANETTRPGGSDEPSLATIKELAYMSEQVQKLASWLERELTAAKHRGKDPHVRSLEVDDQLN